jgi:hypothetical protein
MSDPSVKDDEIPTEVDVSTGVRGLHTIPLRARVFMPASIERSVWEYFSRKSEKGLSYRSFSRTF